MKKLTALLLALILSLSLAACGKSPAAGNSPSADPSQSPAIEADLSVDILTFAAGELSKAENLLTVNGKVVSTPRLLYWLAFSCSYFQQAYAMYGLTISDYSEYILQDCVNMSSYYTLLEEKALELGCPLTDEQQAEVQSMLDQDPAATQSRMDLYGLTAEDMRFLYCVSLYYSNLLDAIIPTPTEDDLNNYVYQTKHILLKTVDTEGQMTMNEDGSYSYPPLDEETVAAKYALAEDILAQLAASDDPYTLFDQLMNTYSEDGRDSAGNLGAPDGYTATPGKMVPQYEEASFALKIGEISGIVESTYGIHIILRGEVEDLDSYAEEYAELQMDSIVQEWVTDADTVISEQLSELSVADFFEKYVAWQSAKLALEEAE